MGPWHNNNHRVHHSGNKASLWFYSHFHIYWSDVRGFFFYVLFVFLPLMKCIISDWLFEPNVLFVHCFDGLAWNIQTSTELQISVDALSLLLTSSWCDQIKSFLRSLLYTSLHMFNIVQFLTMLFSYNLKRCYFTISHKLCGLMALWLDRKQVHE